MQARELIARFPGTNDYLSLCLDEAPSQFAGFEPTQLYTLTYVEVHDNPDGGEPLNMATHSEYYLPHEYIVATCAFNVRLTSYDPSRASPFARALDDILVKKDTRP